VLGEELLYWRCKEIEEDLEPGAGPDSAVEALRNPGQSAAKLWPYEGGRDESDGSWTPPPAALEEAAMRRASMSAINTEPAALREALETGQAVILGLNLWEEFRAAPAGTVGVPTEEDLLGEGHAVALVGFSPDGTFVIRNSWGPTWGEHGLASIEEAAITIAALGAWTIEDDLDS
jgi:Papain family cysteine protease